MSKDEVRGVPLTLARDIAAQANRDEGLRINALKSTMKSRLKYFVRMNLRTFLALIWEKILKNSWIQFVR